MLYLTTLSCCLPTKLAVISGMSNRGMDAKVETYSKWTSGIGSWDWNDDDDDDDDS
jgi:hypothetical protein